MSKMVEPGKWYLVVDCAACGEPIPFAEVPSPEEKPGSHCNIERSPVLPALSADTSTRTRRRSCRDNLVRRCERDAAPNSRK